VVVNDDKQAIIIYSVFFMFSDWVVTY